MVMLCVTCDRRATSRKGGNGASGTKGGWRVIPVPIDLLLTQISTLKLEPRNSHLQVRLLQGAFLFASHHSRWFY